MFAPLRSRARLTTLSLLAALGAGACSTDADDEPCNALENDGPDVIPRFLTSGTTPMGGAIADGTYEQTGLDFYPDEGVTLPPDPRVFSAVFKIAGHSLNAITGEALGEQETESRYSAKYDSSDTHITLNYTCPEAGFIERGLFTATETELRLYYRVMDDTATAEIILTKR